jgi:hypothetical protein
MEGAVSGWFWWALVIVVLLTVLVVRLGIECIYRRRDAEVAAHFKRQLALLNPGEDLGEPVERPVLERHR